MVLIEQLPGVALGKAGDLDGIFEGLALRDHALHVGGDGREGPGQEPEVELARAEQRFPREATRHAYRCGLRAMSSWIRTHAAAASGSATVVGRLRDGVTIDAAAAEMDAVMQTLAAEHPHTNDRR